MPRLIVTEAAIADLERCRQFLASKAPHAARHASQLIKDHLMLLESSPDIGRPDSELPELRELIIPFGDSGYVALYRHDNVSDMVFLLAFRHQKEAGYGQS